MPEPTVPQPWIKDAAERVVLSFIEAFASALLVSGSYNLDTTKVAAIAGITAGLTVVKTLVARLIGNSESASLVA